MPDEFVLATITRARNPDEETLLAGALEALTALGCPVTAGDNGSTPAFLERLRALPNVTVEPIPPDSGAKLQAQAQTALRLAAERSPKRILYTEPDKRWLFENRLPDLLRELAASEPLGATLLSRAAASFATFPAGQRFTESLMNALCEETFGPKGDYQYGPMLLAPAVVPHVCAVTDDIGWGWRQFAAAVAHRLGLPIRLHEGDFPCPPEQRGENELKDRIYRMEQFAQGVRGLALGLKTPLTQNNLPEPDATNAYLAAYAARLLSSFRQAVGRDLIDSSLPPEMQAQRLYAAPFVVLSHDGGRSGSNGEPGHEPIFNYGNQTAQAVFELDWPALTRLPARLSAEPVHQAERQRLLDEVTRRGYLADYRGIRIAASGRRFEIRNAIVWNVRDESGRVCGQAATFDEWHDLPENGSATPTA